MQDTKQILLKNVPIKIYQNIVLKKIQSNKNTMEEVIIEILENHFGE